jgi:DNA-binding NarL/FixJ family response regulator
MHDPSLAASGGGGARGESGGMKTLKVLLAEDHSLMREAVRLVLDDADGMEVVGEAENGEQALQLAAQALPDVVLLDIRMPGMDGLRCLELLRERHPEMTVAILSSLDEPEQINAALRRGAAGYILKSISPDDLPAALRQMVERSVYYSVTNLEQAYGKSARAAGLSEKEIAILQHLAEGRSNRQIAGELFISEQTVKFHLRNIYRKLGINSRTEAMRFAYEHDLVESVV